MGNVMYGKKDNMYDNLLSRKWKKRYEEQSAEVQKKLDELGEKNWKDYQLKTIKRKRAYPEIGDVFFVEPVEGKYFWGVVVNNHIYNIDGDDLLVIMIFRERVYGKEYNNLKIDTKNLLIDPCIVGKEYWTRGLFYTITNINLESIKLNYGFYNIFKGKYFDELGKELKCVPDLVGIDGVCTISGIAYKINTELIIDETLLAD